MDTLATPAGTCCLGPGPRSLGGLARLGSAQGPGSRSLGTELVLSELHSASRSFPAPCGLRCLQIAPNLAAENNRHVPHPAPAGGVPCGRGPGPDELASVRGLPLRRPSCQISARGLCRQLPLGAAFLTRKICHPPWQGLPFTRHPPPARPRRHGQPRRPPPHQHRHHTPTTLPGAGLTSIFSWPIFHTFCNTGMFFLVLSRSQKQLLWPLKVSGPLQTSCRPPSRRQGPRWGAKPIAPEATS